MEVEFVTVEFEVAFNGEFVKGLDHLGHFDLSSQAGSHWTAAAFDVAVPSIELSVNVCVVFGSLYADACTGPFT